MGTPNESRVDRRRLEWLWLVVFLGLFLYIWKGIQSHLLYYGFGVFTAYPVFAWQGDSLRTAFTTPGGVVDALAAILAQAYRDPLPGTLVIVAAVGGLFVGVRRLLHSIQADRLRDLAWVPVILALMIYTRYDDPLATLLALGLAVCMAVLYVSIPPKAAPVQTVLFLALLMPGYYLAGARSLFSSVRRVWRRPWSGDGSSRRLCRRPWQPPGVLSSGVSSLDLVPERPARSARSGIPLGIMISPRSPLY